MGMNAMRALVAPVTSVAVLTVAALALAALTLTGCGNGAIRGLSPEDTDFFMTAEVAETSGASPLTDVQCTSPDGFAVVDMEVQVDFLAVGGQGPVPDPTPLAQFQLTRYIVTYANAVVPGGPVPTPLTVPLDGVEQVPAEFMLMGFPVLTPQQKSQPPLNNPSQNFVNGQIAFTATVTVFGAPITDTRNEISASFPVLIRVFDSCFDRSPCPPPQCVL